ncbi:ABC transporter substrate-binding protein [Candidatus Contubernalis alkaliaceticus]|uniref:ABC transporter substrate-binding protein n=1 Tax=Candidatus Contubernalis alkaliaceticus TaxID=338645 RepID=UPI001F4C3084|nr:ABC transporter substrate-binding protein [Candidatus Contubernalis alkalaceticus]UNC92697.1 ABC transporter substrate-binding protein [Candidatus Contubernalis alkalaceticus]
MKKIISLLLCLLILTAAASVLVGCQDQSLTRVRLNEVTHSVFYAPLYAAINQGYFEQEGINLELTTGQGADKVMTAMLSGQADVGFMGPEATIYVYNQGQEDYAVNFAQLTKRDGSFLVAREPDPDFDWDKVKGKTIIGGRQGGMPLMTLEYVLKNKGITPGEDVDVLTNIQFALMAGAFTGGTGDFVTLFEPVAAALELEGSGFVVASVGEESGEIPYTVFSARKSFIEENPDIIQRFTNAIYLGQRWVENSTPEEIALVISPSFPDVNEEILTAVATRYKDIDAWAYSPIFTEESFERLQDVMETAGELDKRAPFEKLVSNIYAEKAIEKVK